MTTPDVQEIDVTPALASVWLEKNIINRKVSRGRVNQYSRAMESGLWMPSNDSICLSPDGVLLNGQHRLMAIIQSGVTVRMTVHHNMPEEAMKRMDRQYTRSYIHQLAFSGESNTALLASALRLSCAFDMGLNPSGGGGSAVGDADMDIYLMNNPQIRESVEAANRVRVMVDATPTALAVAHWLIARVAGFEHPTQYLQQLGEPTHVGPESPIHAVRRRLVTARTQKVENKNYVYLLLRGWNAYAAGETMAKASIAPLRGKFALPDPLPWGQTESLVD